MTLKIKTAHSRAVALLCVSRAVIWRKTKFRVCPSSDFIAGKPGKHVFGASQIPGQSSIMPFPLYLWTRRAPDSFLHALNSPAHHVRQLAIGPYSFPAQCLCCPGPLFSFKSFGLVVLAVCSRNNSPHCKSLSKSERIVTPAKCFCFSSSSHCFAARHSGPPFFPFGNSLLATCFPFA